MYPKTALAVMSLLKAQTHARLSPNAFGPLTVDRAPTMSGSPSPPDRSISSDADRALHNSWKMLEALLPVMFQPTENVHFPARRYMIRYGCYCYPENLSVPEPRFGYKGAPVDELDALCFKLHKALSCFEKGVLQKPENGCGNVETSTEYSWNVSINSGSSGAEDSREITCDSLVNDPTCVNPICELEKAFVEQVTELIDSGWEPSGNFNNISDDEYEAFCPVEVSGGSGLDSGGEMLGECCLNGLESRLYSEAFQMCCEGGVRGIGAC